MAMYNIEIVVTLKEPAIFAVGHEAGNLIRTHNYIPGNVILGAFVERFLYELKKSAKDSEFKNFFLSDEVRFENLYPAGGEPGSSRSTTPIPLSTLTCKDYPRPRSQKEEELMEDEDKHPYADFLLGEIIHECKKVISSYDGTRTCGAPLKNQEGFYYTKDNMYNYRVYPAKVIRMHNVIKDDIQRPTEEVGGVFSFEALEEELFFRGFICFYDETIRNKFKDVLFGTEEEIGLSLGRARHRGNGEATLKVLDFESHYDIPRGLLKRDFDSRWRTFQENMKNHFTITLHSDAIVADRYLRYHTTLTGSLLAMELGVPPKAIKRLKVFSLPIKIDGFSGIHGLPLESEVAIAKASAFLFEIKQLELLDDIKIGLQRLEEEGIGFRRNEGFGRLIVCDNYHLRFRNLKKGDEKE
jgi:CRISPR-associated protein Csx10